MSPDLKNLEQSLLRIRQQIGQVELQRFSFRDRGLPGMWRDASSETPPSIDLRFTLVLESTKLNARQREVVLCPSPSAQNSALTKSPRLSVLAAWVRFTVRAT